VWKATEKFAEGTYSNFARHLDENTLKSIYGEDKYQKLQEIKTKYDPENFFHWNHNVRPAPRQAAPEIVRTTAAKMKFSRIVIGASDVAESAAFYCDVLGFRDAGDGAVPGARRVANHRPNGDGHFELELVPAEYWKLPNPYHLAFEADSETFENIYKKLKARGAVTVADPPPSAPREGYGEYDARGVRFRRYLFIDPTFVFLEVVNRIPATPSGG
jgi:catechol 2,3-dioxygenase-like lactoylglutathione lyase family enzyme